MNTQDRFLFRTPIYDDEGFIGFTYWCAGESRNLNIRGSNHNAITGSEFAMPNEQCTGLKDKNGTLVYENDFIDSDGVLYQVVYKDCAFVAKPVHLGIDTYIPLKIFDSFYVVGTIHNYISNIHEQGE